MTYRQLCESLTPRYGPGEARAVVRLLLDDAFGLSLTDVVGGALERLSPAETERLQALLDRLLAGEPVQYVVGTAAFCGLRLHVGPGVLIPRPETQELVGWAAQWLQDHAPGGRLLDVGTGSGCIAIALAKQLPQAHVEAWDISPRALAIARDNARRCHADVVFSQRDALQAETDAESAPWDAIVSNPPYVGWAERAQMEPHVVDHEPSEALFVADDDPLLFYRAIARYGLTHLRPGGRLFFEINPLHADSLARQLADWGYNHIELRPDAFGRQRMASAVRPTA